ncbi:MAG: hypothetical protein PHE27_00155 [Alphaproteobacteria bacterium]|nr:hypothetical protein [Alphaproteobacteria bacterium]
MIHGRGEHISSEDFPVQKGRVSKHSDRTKQDVEIVFDNAVLVMPENVLYYLDNREALGWEKNWLPDNEVIDRVMEGGSVKFSPSAKDNLTKKTVHCGYIRRVKEGIIDTRGGDHIYEESEAWSTAHFGQTPPEFVSRIKTLIDLAKKVDDMDYDGPREFILPPVPGYTPTGFGFAKPELNWRDQVDLAACNTLEKLGISRGEMTRWTVHDLIDRLHPGFTNIMHFSFYSVDDDIIAMDLAKRYRYKPDIAAVRNDHAAMFSHSFGIDPILDDERPGWLIFAGDSAKKLRAMKANIVHLDAERPTLEQKVAMVLGAPLSKVETSANKIAVSNRGVCGLEDEIYKVPLCGIFGMAYDEKDDRWAIYFDGKKPGLPVMFEALTDASFSKSFAALTSITSFAKVQALRPGPHASKQYPSRSV